MLDIKFHETQKDKYLSDLSSYLNDEESDYLCIKKWDDVSFYKVTHEIKKRVMKKIPDKYLKELGCKNPDIFIKGLNDDTIVIIPSKTAMKNGTYKKSKVVVDVLKSSDIFNDGTKIPVVKFLRIVKTPQAQDINRFSSLLENEKIIAVVKINNNRVIIFHS
jgi:hypothetical protein